MLTKYLHYSDYPEVRDLIQEISSSLSVMNQFVRQYTLTNGYLPNIKVIFGLEKVQIRYEEGRLKDEDSTKEDNTCNEMILSFDYDDYPTSEEMGKMIHTTLNTKSFLDIHFSNIDISDLDFKYYFEQDSLRINICRALPF